MRIFLYICLKGKYMNLYDRVEEMASALGLSKKDLIDKLDCSRASFYRLKDNPKIQNFDKVFAWFKGKYDLEYLRNGNKVTVEISLPKGAKLDADHLEILVNEAVVA